MKSCAVVQASLYFSKLTWMFSFFLWGGSKIFSFFILGILKIKISNQIKIKITLRGLTALLGLV